MLAAIVVGVPLVIGGCSKSASPDQLSDAEAQNVFEHAFNDNRWWVLLGNQTVIAGNSNFETKKISTAEYEADSRLARAGLISIQVKKDFVHGRFSWGNWFALSQGGARYLIEVQATEEGKKESEKTDPSVRKQDLLHFQFVRLSIDTVVENKDVAKNVDRFHVVKGTGTTHCTDLGKIVADANPQTSTLPNSEAAWWNSFKHSCSDTKIKFITLLKFDAFEKKWKIVTSDLALSDNDFSTSSVTDYLSKS
jgi:hypothetical protein